MKSKKNPPDNRINALNSEKPIRIAIAGNPNAGKTSIFNDLTGTVQSVGNYPGVTVEIKKGKTNWKGVELDIIDLPGTYSLMPFSQEEIVARNYIINEKPDVVINVVDASNLERNLYLTVQLMEMGTPLVLCVNMIDVAEKKGFNIDVQKLSRLMGIQVVKTIGNKNKGIDDLLDACLEVAKNKYIPRTVTYGHVVENEVMVLAQNISDDPDIKKELLQNHQSRWLAVKLIENDPEVTNLIGKISKNSTELFKVVQNSVKKIDDHYNESTNTIISERRYGYASGAVKSVVKVTETSRQDMTNKIDSFICNKFLGPLILVFVVFSLFTAVFKISDEWKWVFGFSPTEVIEWFFHGISNLIHPLSYSMPVLHSLINDGIIAGVGSVLSFVPMIGVMFLFIALLEDWGYVARVAFILDRLLKIFGLQGKSILALILAGGLGAGGCAVPGIMATRTLREEKDRLITILVTPFMNCGAKMPAYFMLIAAFFSDSKALMLFILWLISWFMALFAAIILRKFLFKGEQTPFIMELPPYHTPTLKGVLLHTKERLWSYMKKAGTIILGVNLILWFLMYFPGISEDKLTFYEKKIEYYRNLSDEKTMLSIKNELTREKLLNSFAGKAGELLAPVSRLAGFDWETNIALIGGFAAKEVIVSTFGTAYSMGRLDPEKSENISDRLKNDPEWNKIKAFALMIFILIYAPCFATLAVIRKETGTWKWAAFSTIYSTSLAFLAAFLIYQLGSLFV